MVNPLHYWSRCLAPIGRRRGEETVERHAGQVTAFGNLPRDALLTAADVAEWLKVARRHVQSLATASRMSWLGSRLAAGRGAPARPSP